MYMLCMFYILLSQPSKCIWIGYFSVVLLCQTYSLQSAAELGLPNTQTDEGSSSPSSLATLKRNPPPHTPIGLLSVQFCCFEGNIILLFAFWIMCSYVANGLAVWKIFGKSPVLVSHPRFEVQGCLSGPFTCFWD